MNFEYSAIKADNELWISAIKADYELWISAIKANYELWILCLIAEQWALIFGLTGTIEQCMMYNEISP